MKWTFFFGAVVFLCFALLACTTAPGPSDDRFDKGSHLSSAGPSEIPVGTSTPAEPDEMCIRDRRFTRSKSGFVFC